MRPYETGDPVDNLTFVVLEIRPGQKYPRGWSHIKSNLDSAKSYQTDLNVMVRDKLIGTPSGHSLDNFVTYRDGTTGNNSSQPKWIIVAYVKNTFNEYGEVSP